MRITRETLIRIARETAQKRALAEPALVAAYLTGSLRTEDPFLGGTTDIDIVLVHAKAPARRREVEAVTPAVHLDIVHNPRSDYDKPRELRLHPWLGPELYDPLPLYVSGHFFEFVQAGVRDKYNEAPNVLARARTSAAHGRQIWSGLQSDTSDAPARLLTYFKSVRHAANAVALLVNASPLAERRFLLHFPLHAAAAGIPALTGDLQDLLGAANLDVDGLKACLPAWQTDLAAAALKPKADPRLAPARLSYYTTAAESLLAGETPHALLWSLLLTWTLAAACLPVSRRSAWASICKRLGLIGPAFGEKLAALDAFLDRVEERLEQEPE